MSLSLGNNDDNNDDFSSHTACEYVPVQVTYNQDRYECGKQKRAKEEQSMQQRW